MKQRLIGPFEVQSIGNGLANAAVLEEGFTEIENKPLHAGGAAMPELLFDD